MEQLIIPKYCDPGSILLINTVGILKRLHCPFRVLCQNPVENIQRDMWVWVDEVACTSNDELVYWILGKPYSYKNFLIKISF